MNKQIIFCCDIYGMLYHTYTIIGDTSIDKSPKNIFDRIYFIPPTMAQCLYNFAILHPNRIENTALIDPEMIYV